MREEREQGRLFRARVLSAGEARCPLYGTTFKRTHSDLGISCAYEWERRGNREDAARAERVAVGWSSARTAECKCRVTRQSVSPASCHWSNRLWHASCVLTARTSRGRESSSTTACHAPCTLGLPKSEHETRDGSRTRVSQATSYKLLSSAAISSALLLTVSSVTGKSGPTLSTMIEAAAEAYRHEEPRMPVRLYSARNAPA